MEIDPAGTYVRRHSKVGIENRSDRIGKSLKEEVESDQVDLERTVQKRGWKESLHASRSLVDFGNNVVEYPARKPNQNLAFVSQNYLYRHNWRLEGRKHWLRFEDGPYCVVDRLNWVENKKRTALTSGQIQVENFQATRTIADFENIDYIVG